MAKKKNDNIGKIVLVGGLGVLAYFLMKNTSIMATSENGSGGIMGSDPINDNIGSILKAIQETPPIVSFPDNSSSFFTQTQPNTTDTGSENIVDNTDTGSKKGDQVVIGGIDLKEINWFDVATLGSRIPKGYGGNQGFGGGGAGGRTGNLTLYEKIKKLFSGGVVLADSNCNNGICQTDFNNTKKEISLDTTITQSNNYNYQNDETALNYLQKQKSTTPNILDLWKATPVIMQGERTGQYIIQNSQNLGKYYDYSKKQYVTDLSQVERSIQSAQAMSIAKSTNTGCGGGAIATNSCTGTKKTVNYANTPSSANRYYENTGTSLTRKDLRVGD